jgi:serine/threonine-protein kinase
MGEVYLAKHPRLPRLYALKVLSSNFTQDPEFRLRFTREADLAAALSHPHIVGVHDRGEFEGQLWLAMDYVDGADAGQIVRTRYPQGMPEHEAIDIVAAVADALDYAHERGLLHRDIKPANVLLTEARDGRRRILLADFGIARLADDISGLTVTNMAMGSVAYAAPEQLRGEPVDGRADQYALSATAFHLLTGAPPFQHSNPAVVISQNLTSPAPQLGVRRLDLAHLSPALAIGLEKNPSARYARCRELAEALVTAAAGVTQPAPVAERTQPAPHSPDEPQPAAYPSARPRGRWARIVVPMVVALLFCATSIFAGWQYLRPAPSPITTKSEWQPFIDSAEQFSRDMYTSAPESFDSDFQRVLDETTGDLHNLLVSHSDGFRELVGSSKSTATVNGSGLESEDGNSASVLVALSVTKAATVGDPPAATPMRLRVTVVKTDGTYKVSNIKFRDGGS